MFKLNIDYGRPGSGTSRYYHRRKTGFSLLETLIVLAITAVMLQWGTFTMAEQWLRWKGERVVREMVHLVQQSKVAAAQQGLPLVLCGVDPGVSARDYQCQRDWSQQVVAFFDVDGNGRYSSEDRLFKVLPMFVNDRRLQARANRSGFHVRANGSLKSTPGSIFICSNTVERLALRVIIDRVGRTRVTTYDHPKGGAC